ncbi:type III PLP-dependent enzyme domain-containing protein [Timonella senegalensis]|uniref:alanine racemase n=1 Tax=Timonella senegalensis TaxID=1465825 RepID=UPI00030FB158|nr:alanine racemase [Timonella senegalensis]
MSTHVGPGTKGLALTTWQPLTEVRAAVAQARPAIGSEWTRYPVLELSDSAMEHNLALMATAADRAGCVHAPHIKTSMSPQLVERQIAAGSWGVTTATVGHIAAALSWDIPGLERVFHANEVVVPSEIAFLAGSILERLRTGRDLTIYLYADSLDGVALIAAGLEQFAQAHSGDLTDSERAHVHANLCITIELGVPDGRTGVRNFDQAIAVATAARDAGLSVRGVSGYEGSVASAHTAQDLENVAAYLHQLRDLAGILIAGDLIDLQDGTVVVSAGGSAYLDVVMSELPGPLTVTRRGHDESQPESSIISVIPVVRAGAYIIHDHGLLERANPWVRMPATWLDGAADAPLPRAAAHVHAVVLSTPEPGLALLNVGRRDVPFDIDLPLVVSHNGWTVTSVNDQHAFVRADAEHQPLAPGDVVKLGISHPCTIFDKWATALVTNDAHEIIDIIETQF